MNTSKKVSHRTIHWFRKGLRLHDNPALLHACETSTEIWPVYVLNPDIITYGGNIGFNRWRFLLESLKDLDVQLKNFNSRLIVIQDEDLKKTLLKHIEDWKITQLTFEIEPEPHRRERDDIIMKYLEEKGVEVMGFHSHNLYDLSRIIEKNNGEPPLTYRKFQSVLGLLGQPQKPAPCLTAEHFKRCSTPLTHNKNLYPIPSLAELGIAPEAGELAESKYPGGERVALKRMETSLENEGWVNSFEKPQTSPNSLEPSTTVLSPYITFGCLSVKNFYWKVWEVYSKAKRHSSPPVSLHGQIFWREFYYTIGSVTPKYDKMEGNDICLQVPWDINEEYLEAWRTGRTGYPFIDAIMTQLRTEGWIHHLARHAVACFLTRGDLWISWEHGQKVFETYLLDHDWCLNAGNWLWLSASAFFHAYFRVYSPIAFGKKTDPNGDYIRKYVPCLEKFPKKYIFEPWSAPDDVQKKYGCIIGKDYPKPIVDHQVVKQRNIEKMKMARKAKYGDDSSNEKESSSIGNNKRLKDKKDSHNIKRQRKLDEFLNVRKEGSS